ncbi:MAG: SurA N-terminal domain-containing protein [bacterium]
MNRKMLRDLVILALIAAAAAAGYTFYPGRQGAGGRFVEGQAPPAGAPPAAVDSGEGAPGGTGEMRTALLNEKKDEAFREWFLGAYNRARIERSADPANERSVAAKVDGTVISAKDFRRRLDSLKRMHAGAVGGGAAGAPGGEDDAAKRLLDRMIEETLISNEAKKMGVAVTEREMEEVMKEKRAGFGSEREFREMLEMHGFTVEDVSEQLGRELLTEKLREEITKDVVLTDEEIKAFRSNAAPPENPPER